MKRQKGFTLVEMVMVMIIVGVVSAIAMTRFNRNSFAVEAAAGELVSAIRYAQEKSMTNTGDTDFKITLAANGYTVTQGVTNIANPETGVTPYTSSWTDVTLSPTGTFSFDGYGKPSVSGGLAWSGNQEQVAVSVGADTSNVSIEQETGFAR